MTHIKKIGIFHSAKISFSHIYEKIHALFDLMGCVWHEAFSIWFVFDDLMIFIVGYYNAAMAKQPRKALQNTVGRTSPHPFIFVLYSIPRACQMDSLWSVRILSPPFYFLEADKTGGSASTSDWPESCFSKLQCRGCLALTSNELDIYTFHTDKSEPIHTEGLYTYRICTAQCAQYEHCRVKLTNLATLASWLQRNRLFILMHNGAYYCWALYLFYTKDKQESTAQRLYVAFVC